MTYQEFMQWAEENEELKAVVPEELSRWFNRDDVMERLKYITIYPNQYTNVPFSDGCYQDKNGEWYYYTQLDERTSLVPNGNKYPEEECFKKLKNSVMYKLQQIEAEERQLREKQERMSSEEKEQKERIKAEQEKEQLIRELFREENRDAESIEAVVIDVEKIYQVMDDTDEGDSNFAEAKKNYEELYDAKTAIQFFKIYKYMNKLSSLIQSGSYMQVDLLILQKIGLVFGDMNAKEDKKIIAAK